MARIQVSNLPTVSGQGMSHIPKNKAQTLFTENIIRLGKQAFEVVEKINEYEVKSEFNNKKITYETEAQKLVLEAQSEASKGNQERYDKLMNAYSTLNDKTMAEMSSFMRS